MLRFYVCRGTHHEGNFEVHEIHKEGCVNLPVEGDRVYLGEFNSCSLAENVAHQSYDHVKCCLDCCPECKVR